MRGYFVALVGVYNRINGGGEVEEGKFGGFRLCENKISLKALYFSKFSPVIGDQFSIVYPLYILQYIYIYILPGKYVNSLTSSVISIRWNWFL